MYSRLIEPPKDKSFFLFGPRGTGKTTWVKSRFANAVTGKPSSSMMKGLRAFQKDYPGAKAYFIYGGERQLRDGDIAILPMKDVLKNLPKILSS